MGVYRTIEDISWVPALAEYARLVHDPHVRLGQPDAENPFLVHLVDPLELPGVVIPQGKTAEELESEVQRALGPAFLNELDVATTGVMYLERFSQSGRYGPLVLKFRRHDRLVRENGLLVGALRRYGLNPARATQNRFNAVIGAISVGDLPGEDKVRLRYGLGDRIPATLALGRGVVKLS